MPAPLQRGRRGLIRSPQCRLMRLVPTGQASEVSRDHGPCIAESLESTDCPFQSSAIDGSASRSWVGVSTNFGDCGCGDLTIGERWNGSGWSVMQIRNPGTNNDALNGVSCTSPTACIAVGSKATTLSAVLAERWNGSSWSVLPTPRGVQCGGDLCDNLNAVSCISTNACIAVSARGDGPPYAPLVARYSHRRR